MFETLESRLLFSAKLHAGVLTIVGNENPERWKILDPHFSGLAELHVFRNDRLVGLFNPNDVKSIVMNVGAGDDRIEVSPVSIPTLILGGKGDDHLHAAGAQHTLVGGDGDDEFLVEWSTAAGFTPRTRLEVIGGRGDDDIQMGNTLAGDADAPLLISAGAGDDYMALAQSIDTISCGEGDDTVLANPGNDRIDGNAGNDLILGDFGNDKIDGGEGDDSIYGGEGNDTLTGGPGRDRIIAHNGDDTIFARDNQRDTLHGDNGTDAAAFDNSDRATDLVGEIEELL
jgi:Ca2+-binding RTX toxin-like protein